MLARAVPFSLLAALTMTSTLRAQETVAEVEAACDRLWQQNDGQGVVELLDRALLKLPNAASLWWRRAFAKGRLGDVDGGIADATRAIELAPQDKRGWIERGYLRGAKGDLKAALADLDQAVVLAPTEAIAFGDRGDIKQRLGDWLGARADYDQALVLRPLFGAARHNRAVASMRLGAWTTAVDDQKAAIPLCPPMASMWVVLAEAQEQLGRHHDAVRSYTRAQQIGGESEHVVGFARAQANFARGRGDAARTELALLANDPQLPAETRALLGHWLGGMLLHAGQSEAARTNFVQAAADPSLFADAVLMQWCATPDPAAANQALREALAAAAPEAKAQLLGLVDLCLGERPAAEVAIEQPDRSPCRAWFLAAWRAVRNGDDAEARTCFRRCLNTGTRGLMHWHLARAQLGLATIPAAPGSLGLSLRTVADSDPPQLEVAAVDADGPAAVQGLAPGLRITMLNDQSATMAAFTTLQPTLAVGTPVRLLVVDGTATVERWLVAGSAAP